MNLGSRISHPCKPLHLLPFVSKKQCLNKQTFGLWLVDTDHRHRASCSELYFAQIQSCVFITARNTPLNLFLIVLDFLPTPPIDRSSSMWIEILCGLLFFRIFRRFFYEDDEDVLQIDTTDSSAIFHVANRLEKLYGGRLYVGLRIPDADSTSKQSIDAVLVTKGFAMVVAVRNFSGFVDIEKDGSWICSDSKSRRKELHPDPVRLCMALLFMPVKYFHIWKRTRVPVKCSVRSEDKQLLFTCLAALNEAAISLVVLETKRQVAVLETYLEQRGVTLPEGYLIGKVVLPNPKCRLELKGDKYVLGEFSEFKGKLEDVQALRSVKRTKVSRLIIQKSTMFGGLEERAYRKKNATHKNTENIVVWSNMAPTSLSEIPISGRSKVQVLYAPRDYRSEGFSSSEWKEATVKSSTEVVFLPLNSKKTLKIKLSSIVSISLSA
ncbi:hypothetical protein ACLOJK_030535 [Asimina triloba]